MYEVELRALTEDFVSIKGKLDSFAHQIKNGERETTIFFSNPHKMDFDLRLKLKKDKYFLSFKSDPAEHTRREIESDVGDPEAIYEMLISSGFRLELIIVRKNYLYEYDGYEVLLSEIIDWGNAIEVEKVVDNKENARTVEKEIKEFMVDKLGIKEILSREELVRLNGIYASRSDFGSIKVKDLMEYVSGNIGKITLLKK